MNQAVSLPWRTLMTYTCMSQVAGSTKAHTSVVSGVVCTKNLAHKHMSQQISHASVLLLQCPIVYQRVENKFSSLEPQILQVRHEWQHGVAAWSGSLDWQEWQPGGMSDSQEWLEWQPGVAGVAARSGWSGSQEWLEWQPGVAGVAARSGWSGSQEWLEWQPGVAGVAARSGWSGS